MQLLKREFVHKGFLKIKLKINKSEKKNTLFQAAFTCSKLTTETLEQGVKYV